jgi:hypothetical protein
MSNVLSDEKKQQVLVLGKLGWPLRRIEKATGVRRETAGDYLKAAGIAVSRPGRPGSNSKPAIRVATDSDTAKPANEEGVTTDFIRPFAEKAPIRLAPPPPASACEPFREIIQAEILKGRNAVGIWQDLVTRHGFTGAYNTVKRFVGKLRGVRLVTAKAPTSCRRLGQTARRYRGRHGHARQAAPSWSRPQMRTSQLAHENTDL